MSVKLIIVLPLGSQIDLGELTEINPHEPVGELVKRAAEQFKANLERARAMGCWPDNLVGRNA